MIGTDAGQVVGQITVDGVSAATWSAAGGLQDLNTLYAGVLPTGFVLTNATAIDDNGDIAGYGTDASGNTEQAFLLRTALPGDANLDGKVDINDLTIVLSLLRPKHGNEVGAPATLSATARLTSTT